MADLKNALSTVAEYALTNTDFRSMMRTIGEENVNLSAISYALFKGLRVRDFFEMIEYAWNDLAKLQYHFTKLFNKRSSDYSYEDAYFIQLVTAKKPLPLVNVIYYSGSKLQRKFLPPANFDYSQFGDQLSTEDWSQIYAEFLSDLHEYDRDAFNLLRDWGKKILPDKKAQEIGKLLMEFCGVVSEEYGLNSSVLYLKLGAVPEIRNHGWEMFINEQEKQAIAEEQFFKDFEKLKADERKASSQPVARPFPLSFPKTPTSIPEKPLISGKPLKKYNIFIVGGEIFNVPSWIRESFNITHATGSVSGERAREILGIQEPDLILVMRFVSHTTSTPITTFARRHNIPILVAKPAIAAAVKHAEERGPEWFAAAYHRWIRRNPWYRRFY